MPKNARTADELTERFEARLAPRDARLLDELVERRETAARLRGMSSGGRAGWLRQTIREQAVQAAIKLQPRDDR
jgi:hypothetical protein